MVMPGVIVPKSFVKIIVAARVSGVSGLYAPSTYIGGLLGFSWYGPISGGADVANANEESIAILKIKDTNFFMMIILSNLNLFYQEECPEHRFC